MITRMVDNITILVLAITAALADDSLKNMSGQ